jgi:hypothetical protein
MSPSTGAFTPPPLSSHEGPADFTPPPLSSHEGPSTLPADAVDIQSNGLPADAVDVSTDHQKHQASSVLDAVGRFGQGFYDKTLKGVADTAEAAVSAGKTLTGYGDRPPDQAISDAVTAAPGAIVQAAKNAYNTHAQLLQQAKNSAAKGNYSDAIERGMNALVPVLGPSVQASLDKAKSGDVAGGLGELFGNLATVVSAAPGVPETIASKAGELASGLGRVAKTATTGVLGGTTGVGAVPLRQALERPTPELVSAMRGGTSESDVLNNFKSALQDLRDARSSDYQAKLQALPQTPVDISSVKNTLANQLQKFNVKEVPAAKPGDPPTLDFSRSTIRDPGAQAELRSIHDDINGWGTQPGDTTPKGVDTLKRRIDDTYSPSSSARAIVQAVKGSARDTLNSQVPGYADMTKGYASASNFLDQLQDLKIDSANPGTTTRTLTTALRQNNDFRQGLVEELGQLTNKDLMGQLAGMNLSKVFPQGLAKAIDSGVGLLGAVFHGALTPHLAIGAAAASPKLMGELMYGLSKLKPALNAASHTVAAFTPAAMRAGAAGALSSGAPAAGMSGPAALPMAASNNQPRQSMTQ